MAGARSLWRATGMTEGDFGKPIIAIANLVHRSLYPAMSTSRTWGNWWRAKSKRQVASRKEFNTIAIDDGIAMGMPECCIRCPAAS